ncbi:MAG: hypothetical protein LBQ66_13635 [Planctomycetaceae bacterium]|jgi:hypothetical protein|nr:hypothetical protein [Planctomycetaceae bacterium]
MKFFFDTSTPPSRTISTTSKAQHDDANLANYELDNPRFFATLRDGMATEIDELYNEWKAAQDKKKKEKEKEKEKKKEKELNNKTNPIQPVADIDSEISENLPIVENKNNRDHFGENKTTAIILVAAFVILFTVVLWKYSKHKRSKKS